jgi:hypothetical protein
MEASQHIENSKPFTLDATKVVGHIRERPRRKQRVDVSPAEVDAEALTPVRFGHDEAVVEGSVVVIAVVTEAILDKLLAVATIAFLISFRPTDPWCCSRWRGARPEVDVVLSDVAVAAGQ